MLGKKLSVSDDLLHPRAVLFAATKGLAKRVDDNQAGCYAIRFRGRYEELWPEVGDGLNRGRRHIMGCLSLHFSIEGAICRVQR